MNELQIDELLDAVSSSQISKADAERQLQQALVPNPAGLIESHLQAVALVKQYAILEAVKNARFTFEKGKQRGGRIVSMPGISARRWLYIAATVMAIPFLYFGLQLATYSKQQMVNDLNEEFAINTPRGVSETGIDSLLQAFNAQQFDEVVRHYHMLSVPTLREQFLAGYAYQQLGDFDASVVLLEKLIQQNKMQGSTLYNDDAEYYLALAAIQLNQPEKAYQYLKAIEINEEHTYHEKVNRKLLWKLWWMR
jgi:tetratricopeptide (TPR) repeat protein